MKRMCMSFLNKWIKSDDRLPLVIRGARQVGKTWVARNLAETHGKHLIEVNFEDRGDLAVAFKSNDPHQILERLETLLEIPKIKPDETLLLLDEIQVIPELYSKLRWFAEKMPELAVIATGSLLDFILSQYAFSVPVGRVQYMYLEPMSFEEFLLAKDRDSLVRTIHRFSWNDEMPQHTHDTLMELVKEYVIVGGMPAVVKKWLKTGNLEEVSGVQQIIVKNYKEDFNKYRGRLSEHLLGQVFSMVPRLLAHKFIYSRVTDESHIGAIKSSLSLICRARICHKIISTKANGVPLGAEIDDRFIKVIFLDVGLCSAELGLNLRELVSTYELTLVNSGGIAEQLVGQLLRTIEPFYKDPALYYWQRVDSDAEVDYVIQHGSRVVPIEVKAGSQGKLRSLHAFMHRKGLPLAVRVHSGIPQVHTVDVKNKEGKQIKYELRSIPFYLMSELSRLLN